MIKSRKMRRNRYRESKIRLLKGKIRQFRAIFGVLAVFCMVLLLSAGLTRLYQALLETRWLRVEEIETAGLKKIDRIDVLNTMGVTKGECILNLRMSPIADRLRKLPMVKTASVQLELPGKLIAEITEREPAALLKGSDLYMVDEEGILFASFVPEQTRTVPLITGLCAQNLKVGDSIPAQDMKRIRELLAAFKKSADWLPVDAVMECRWGAGGFTLIVGERGVPVEIGREDFNQKLTRLKQVIATISDRQWAELVTRIDLDYPGKAYLEGNFPVPKQGQGSGKQPG